MSGPCTTIRQYRDRDQDRQNRNDAELEAARQEADSFSFGLKREFTKTRLRSAMSTYQQFIESSPPPEFVIKASDRHAETLIRILVALQQSEELTIEETFTQKFTKGETHDVGELLQVAHNMTTWKSQRNLWSIHNQFEHMNHEDSVLYLAGGESNLIPD